MKKVTFLVLFLLVMLLLLVLGSFLYFSKEPQTKASEKSTKIGTLGDSSERSENSFTVKEPASSTEGEATINVSEGDENDRQLACLERFRSQSEWKEIEAILSSIYMNGEEAAGQGVYQQMPLEAVKSYADSGDKSAMLHYGSELMWKSAFGVHINPINRNPGESTEAMGERAKKHQPDLERFYEGVGYAYQAAVLGKLGATMEISSLSKGLLRKMVRTGQPKKSILEVFVQRQAYLNLMQKVHQNDEVLLAFFSSSDELQEDLDLLFQEVEIKPNKLAQIKAKIGQESKRLIEQWEKDRSRIGLTIYPELMPKRLAVFFGKMERECR
ncbi:hypothetical protein DZA50_00685 [Kangiella sp. HD9-110m-PIT-SAG07]|nr:hypothetical protein DZA50_00685 [Kangiella sp. HD9-110m-PIT-SAG07]